MAVLFKYEGGLALRPATMRVKILFASNLQVGGEFGEAWYKEEVGSVREVLCSSFSPMYTDYLTGWGILKEDCVKEEVFLKNPEKLSH